MSKDDEKNTRSSYAIGISFPIEPTEEYLKELRRDIAHSRLNVISGKKLRPKLLKSDKPSNA